MGILPVFSIFIMAHYKLELKNNYKNQWLTNLISNFKFYFNFYESTTIKPIISATSAPVVASTSGLGVKNSMRSPWLVFRNGEPTPISLSSVNCVQMPEFNGFLIHYGPEIK